MNRKIETVETYDRSAKALAAKFDSQGARVENIQEAFALVQKENPGVLEIGCGNGRDAVEITKYTDTYLGIDISQGLLDLAREKLPAATFELADIETFDFQRKFDMIFAFASLIHVNRESLKEIMGKMFASLNENGVVYLSLKYNEEYTESTKDDEFGTRTYYLYSDKEIAEMASTFTIIKNEISNLRGQRWLDVILKKS